MSTLNGFHIKVENTCFGIGSDSSIAGVCKWAGLPVTKTCDIVFISAEILILGRLQLERTKLPKVTVRFRR